MKVPDYTGRCTHCEGKLAPAGGRVDASKYGVDAKDAVIRKCLDCGTPFLMFDKGENIYQKAIDKWQV